MKSISNRITFVLYATALSLALFACPGCFENNGADNAGTQKDNVTKKGSAVFVTDPFDTVYASLGPGSEGDDLGRKNIWASYRGKFVTWTAKMGGMKLLKDESVNAELVHIRTNAGVEALCIVNFPPPEAEKTLGIPPGSEVVYQGRLAKYSSAGNKTVFHLKNGKVIRFETN